MNVDIYSLLHTLMSSSERSKLRSDPTMLGLPWMHTYATRRYLSSLEDRLKLVESRVTTLENVSPNDLSKVTIPGTLSDAGSTDTAQQETASLRDDSLDNAESTEDPIDGMAAVTFAREDDCASFGICLLMITSK